MNHRRTNWQTWAVPRLWLVVLLHFISSPFQAIGLAHLRAIGTATAAIAGPAGQGHYLYTGEQIDPDLGMYYLRARYSTSRESEDSGV